MPIKCEMSGVNASVQRAVDTIHAKAIRRLAYIGEMCINEARGKNNGSQKGSYTDQTGNLRSSIGYVIADNGNIVDSSSFDVVKQGSQGSADGRSFAQRIAASYPSNLVLIVVAGMNYAVHVQHKGYDVLASAETLARDLVRKMKL